MAKEACLLVYSASTSPGPVPVTSRRDSTVDDVGGLGHLVDSEREGR